MSGCPSRANVLLSGEVWAWAVYIVEGRSGEQLFYDIYGKLCLEDETLSTDVIKPLFLPTSFCMYTFYEAKMEISSLRGNAINMIICVFSIHLQIQQQCTVFMFHIRVIHFNVSTEDISHCFSILSDIGQRRHPFIIFELYWISVPTVFKTVFVISFITGLHICLVNLAAHCKTAEFFEETIMMIYTLS